MANNLVIHEWPNGIVTVAGTKKKIPGTFRRPWQARIPDPKKVGCPFHSEYERTNALLSQIDQEGESWYVIDSAFAPEKPHRLIIPDTCWGEERMRKLGSFAKIYKVTSLAIEQLSREISHDRDKLWAFSIQIGPLAAQNVPHCHYHLYRPNMFDGSGKPMNDPPPAHTAWHEMEVFKKPEFLVFEYSNFRVIAGGQYTGMLFFVPTERLAFEPQFAAPFTRLINLIVELCAKRFRSVEGLAPDFKLEFEIHRGQVTGGFFIPKLNNTGTLEDMAMLDPRRGWNLAWSHEETAAYLRS